MNAYLLLLTFHIVSAAILFGTGLGIAYFMGMAWRTRNVTVLAATLRHVVVADFVFTAAAVLVQPLTGIGLIVTVGHDPGSAWLVWTYALYGLAGVCWLPVVRIQMRLARLARHAAAAGQATMPPEACRLMRVWFWLGWPAFVSVLTIYGLMVAKPTL